MKILSLFDGMAVARQAIKELHIPLEKYYASEIDNYATQVAISNHPDIIQLGNVKNVQGMGEEEIDFIIGGSPCQDLSIAKKNRQGLNGEKSGLFWEYVRILQETKPKLFILENVASMPKEAKQTISEVLGVEPVLINASLVSAQNRRRLFWVGKWDGKKYQQVKISQPKDRGILLKDILESNVEEKYYLSNKIITNLNPVVQGVALRNRGSGKKPEFNNKEKANAITTVQTDSMVKIGHLNSGGQGDRIYSTYGKSVTLSANGGGRGSKTGLYQEKNQSAENAYHIRRLTPTECLRLQSMPDNYFEKAEYKGKPISNTQRYKLCGNAFNAEVIKHILKEVLQ